MYGAMLTAAIQCMHTNVGHDWACGWGRGGEEGRREERERESGEGGGGEWEREGWGGEEGESAITIHR